MSVNARVQCLLRRVHAIRSELASSGILPQGGLALPPLTGIALHSEESTGHGGYHQHIPPRPIFPPGTSPHKKERYNEMVELLDAVSHLVDTSSTPYQLTPRVQRYLMNHQPTDTPEGSHPAARRGRYISFEEAWSYYEVVFGGMAAVSSGQGIQIALEPVGPMACCVPFFLCSFRKAVSSRQPSTPLKFLLSTTRPVPSSSLLHALQRQLLSVNAAHSTYIPATAPIHVNNNITGLNLFPSGRPPPSGSTDENDVSGDRCFVDTPQYLIPCEVEVVPYDLVYVRVLLDSSPPELLYQCFKGAEERGLSIHRAKGIRIVHPDRAKSHCSRISDRSLQVVPTSLKELVELLGVTTMAEDHFPSIVS